MKISSFQNNSSTSTLFLFSAYPLNYLTAPNLGKVGWVVLYPFLRNTIFAGHLLSAQCFLLQKKPTHYAVVGRYTSR